MALRRISSLTGTDSPARLAQLTERGGTRHCANLPGARDPVLRRLGATRATHPGRASTCRRHLAGSTIADEDAAARVRRAAIRRRAGSRSPSRATGGRRRRFAGQPTAHCSTATLFEQDRPAVRGETPQLADVRRALLPGRRLARRRLPRRHRGLLPPAHLRGHRADRRRGPSTPSPSRSPAHRRPTGPRSATSPASSSTGTCLDPTGTPAASGDRCDSSTPVPCASATSVCCAARRRPERAVVRVPCQPR